MNIGLLFKIARIKKELSQKEVSCETGLTEATISEIENNKTNWKLDTVKPLLELYGQKLIITPKGE